MSERAKFEQHFDATTEPKSKDGTYHRLNILLLYCGWKACAELKQAELDKAYSRIAELEDSFKEVIRISDREHMAWTKAKSVLSKSSSNWLAEHDKEVEVKVLEEVIKGIPDEWNGDSDTYAVHEADMETLEWLKKMAESRRMK